MEERKISEKGNKKEVKKIERIKTLMILAKALKSSILPLVQLPMKTKSMGFPIILSPSAKPI